MDTKQNNRNFEPENELNKKQVFTDLHTKSQSAPVLIERYADLPEPIFDKKAILDEAYAERKNQREQAEKTASKPVRVPRPLVRPPRPIPSLTARRKVRAKSSRFRSVPIKDIRLYSGELSSDAARRILREFGALLVFCAFVAAVFGVKGWITDRMTNDDYSSLARSTSYSAVVSLETYSWAETVYCNGVDAAQTACTQVGSPITDFSGVKKDANVLLNPTVVASKAEAALTADRVQLKTNMSNLDLVLQIYKSLENGKPTIVLFSDKKENAIRYGVVTYMSPEDNEIRLLVAENTELTLTLEQFIAATRFDNTKDLPFQIRAGLLFGAWARNTAIFVK